MPPSLRCSSVLYLPPTYIKQCYKTSLPRSFSSTSRQDQRLTRNRRALFSWLNLVGTNFREPAANSTNYLSAYTVDGILRRSIENTPSKNGADQDANRQQEIVEGDILGEDGGPPGLQGSRKTKTKDVPPETQRDLRPFPTNTAFRSQAVLSEELREKIWERIMLDGKSVRDVSAELNVEMSRVGAVVRLMEIEKEWKRIGKPLARPYAQAVMSMLPKTKLGPDHTHESINDLPLHSSTAPQLFYPTSESRQFTRVDAAKAFDEKLLPADDRVPHPELSLMHKDFLAGHDKKAIADRQAARDEVTEQKREIIRQKQLKKAANLKVVESSRWAFRITPVNVDDIGSDGRGSKGVGWRYGKPLMDRSRAQVKIPTRAGL